MAFDPLSKNQGRKKKVSLLFVSETLALASFLAHQIIIVPRSAESDSGFGMLFFTILLLLFILITLGIGKALGLYTAFLASKFREDETVLARGAILTLAPFVFLYLVFLQHIVSLNELTAALLFVSCAGFIYLHVLFITCLAEAHAEKKPIPGLQALKNLDFLSPKQIHVLVIVIPLVIFSLLGTGLIVPKHPLTGDEPHYLLITRSILKDGDINLMNNYQNEDFLDFYPGPLKPHTRPGKKGEQYQYSRHSPGLSLLIVPFYVLGEHIGSVLSPDGSNPALKTQFIVFFARFPIVILAALLSGVLYMLAYDLTQKKQIALLAWLVFCFTSPVVFYSQLVYPEVPAALICILVFRETVIKRHFSASKAFLIGLGLSILPWLNPKYAVLSLALFILNIQLFVHSERIKPKAVFSFLSPLFLSTGLYLLFLLILYGSISPTSIYEFTEPYKNITFSMFYHFNGLEFIRCGLGYLFDQTFGIFPLSPIFMLFLPGLIFLFKRNKKASASLLTVFILYWAFCSLSYYWGGYCPPGRTLFPVVWILVLFVAGAFHGRQNKVSRVIRRILLFASFSAVFVAIQNPRLLYHEVPWHFVGDETVYSHFFTRFSNLFADLRNWVPSLVNKNHILWIPTTIWLLAFVAIAFIFIQRKTGKGDQKAIRLQTHVWIVFLLSFFCFGYVFFNIRLDSGHSFEGKDYELFFQDQNNYGQELNGFWTRGKSQTAVVIKTPAPVSQFEVKLSSLVKGQTRLRVGKFITTVARQDSADLGHSLNIRSPVGFPWKDSYLYLFHLKENNGFYPFRLNKKMKDNRFLGIFVEINTF